MLRDINGSSPHPLELESNLIYDYLEQIAIAHSPPEVINEFKTLLLQGRNKNKQVSKALEKIVISSVGQQQFAQILNCCCCIILDCWSKTPASLSYVLELLCIFEASKQQNSYNRFRKQLTQLIKDYQQTKLYYQVKAIISIINPEQIATITLTSAVTTKEISTNGIEPIINTYIARYPYLYSYFLEPNTEQVNLKEYIQILQENRQQDFEVKLSKHIIYRFRLKQAARMKLLTKGVGKVIDRVDNPTLLSERAFKVALNQYLKPVEGNKTIKERSQRFVADNCSRSSYQVFKQDLYHFLITDIQLRNSSCQFASQLKQKLEQIFSQSNAKPLNNNLVLQTCRQLFSFLVVEPNSSIDSHKLTELIANLGTAQAMKLLVKITLICPEAKPDLEKKIALIVTHYQLHNIHELTWLLKVLEHLLIAFSIYFGKIDVSIAKAI